MIHFFKYFKNLSLDVKWDEDVKQSLRPRYRSANQARISFMISDLLIGIGYVQPKRLKPSAPLSLIDYGHLIEKFEDSPELKLRINEIRTCLEGETLGKISEEIGVGLSVVVTTKLFPVLKSTICRIKRTGGGKRPDWKCLLNDNQSLHVEAKGCTSKGTRTTQLKEAIEQKNSLPADFCIAAATLLKEDNISEMIIKDPPSSGDYPSTVNRKLVYRAYHYSSVFSFMGEEALSIYFEKMAKRLSGEIRPNEMGDKEMMFNFLLDAAPCVRIEDDEFSGHLYGPIDNQYIFLGVNKNLLYYQGFMEFQDADEEKLIEKDGNQYVIHTDGILVVNVENYDSFNTEYHIESTGVSLDTFALTDLDSISASSFRRYVKYLLDKCDENTQWTIREALVATVNNQKRLYFVFHVRNYKGRRNSFRTLMRIHEFMDGRQGVLVTNIKIPQGEFEFPCIDRADFERIASTHADRDIVKEIFGR